MEAVLDKLHKVSKTRLCANFNKELQSQVPVPRWCANYSDACIGTLAAKVSSLETQPNDLGGARTQVVCNSVDMPAQPTILSNEASLPEIKSSTIPTEVLLDDGLKNCGMKQQEGKIQALPYQRQKVAQRLASLKHANNTISDQRQHEPASYGSIGHPHFCAQACKYIDRKSGCRDGRECPNCHFCSWRRTRVALKPNAADKCPKELTMHGVLGSSSLGEPLKIDLLQCEDFYLETTTRPQSGAQLRLWCRDDQADLKLKQHKCPEQESGSKPDGCPSVGSVNHPHNCGLPCKYAWKKKCCKDGYLCTRCHVCKWNRYVPQHTSALSSQ